MAGIGRWLPRGCRLQSLASLSLALASRSEQRLRVRWGKRTGEPSAAGAQGGGPRQWEPVRPSLLRGCERAISRARARAEPARRTRSTRSVRVQPDPTKGRQVSPRAASEPAIFPGNGQHEVWAASRREASQAARLPSQGNAGNAAHAGAREGPGRDSETLTGWARIPECVPRREIGTRDAHLT